MGGLGVLLLGTGVTAFGIAPLAPDAADLPVRQVVEALDAPTQQDIQSLLAAQPATSLVLAPTTSSFPGPRLAAAATSSATAATCVRIVPSSSCSI